MEREWRSETDNMTGEMRLFKLTQRDCLRDRIVIKRIRGETEVAYISAILCKIAMGQNNK